MLAYWLGCNKITSIYVLYKEVKVKLSRHEIYFDIVHETDEINKEKKFQDDEDMAVCATIKCRLIQKTFGLTQCRWHLDICIFYENMVGFSLKSFEKYFNFFPQKYKKKKIGLNIFLSVSVILQIKKNQAKLHELWQKI